MAKKSSRGTRKPRKATRSRSAQRHKFTRGLYGWITHTDLASNDPAATKAWCAEVLGWTAAFANALRAGAEEMMSPTRVMEGVTVAIVRAPGGVPIGFSGP